MKSNQTGASLIIVLVMLTVLLLGTVTMLRSTETSAFLSGNIAYKTAALQAAEIGVSEAFEKMKTLADPDNAQPGWYFPTRQGVDGAGILTTANWNQAAKVTVGAYEAAYVVERLCEVTPVTDQDSQCFVKRLATTSSAKAGAEALEAPTAVQYRLTVSVLGPKSTRSFVQVLATP